MDRAPVVRETKPRRRGGSGALSGLTASREAQPVVSLLTRNLWFSSRYAHTLRPAAVRVAIGFAAMVLSSHAGALRNSINLREASSHSAEAKSGLPVSRFTGTETCSWTMRQSAPVFR